jgi:hypothetical protein
MKRRDFITLLFSAAAPFRAAAQQANQLYASLHAKTRLRTRFINDVRL